MSNIEIKHQDTLRTERELLKMSLKEKCERAVASANLIHNLEYQAKHLGATLNDNQREIIARLNREMDVIMKDPSVRRVFENEVKDGGTAVIYVPT